MAQAEKQGRYAIVDTTLTKVDATLIDALSGRQGDSGRIVYFAMKDGNLPHNLDGQDVSLEVKDASGKIKVLTGIHDRINATAGLFSMLIPAEFYQSAGDVEEAYLSVNDVNNTVISTVPITFTVFANGIILSANASQDYIDTVQKFLDEFDKRITTTSNNLEGVRTAVNSLNDAITNYTDLVNTKAVAVKTSTNEFTENNTFDKDLTVKGAIHGKADSAVKADSAKKADSATTAGKADSATKATTADNAKNLATTAILDNSMKSHTKSINVFGGKMDFHRIGNSVTVHLEYGANAANYQFKKYSTFYPAGTVPAGYRPAVDNYDVWFDTDAGTAYKRSIGSLSFRPDGSIGARNAYVTDTNKVFVSISGTYITADDMPTN